MKRAVCSASRTGSLEPNSVEKSTMISSPMYLSTIPGRPRKASAVIQAKKLFTKISVSTGLKSYVRPEKFEARGDRSLVALDDTIASCRGRARRVFDFRCPVAAGWVAAAQALFDGGRRKAEVAAELDVKPDTLRKALADGRLRAPAESVLKKRVAAGSQ